MACILHGKERTVWLSMVGDAETAAREIRAFGGQAEAMFCDVADFDAVGKMIEKIVEKYGRIDIVVNNAAITESGALLSLTEKDFDRQTSVKMKGSFNCCRHAVPYMIRQGGGTILNCASDAWVGLTIALGCISVFVPQINMIALTVMFVLNAGLHFAVWERSVRRGKPSAALLLAAYAFYQVTHGSSLLTIQTALSRVLGLLAIVMGTLTLFFPVPAVIGISMILNGAERLIMALVNRNDRSKANQSLTGQSGSSVS